VYDRLVDTSEALHARVRRFMDAALGGAQRESFDALACDIARWQRVAVEPVGRLMAARGERELARAENIPAMPTDAFRLRRIAAHAAEQDERCFATSGTTAEARGLHPMRTTATYARAAVAWGRRMLFPDVTRMRLVALASDESTAPRSSLSFMLARFAEALGGDASWHWDGARLDIEGIARAIASTPAPLLVAGTSFAFVHLLDTHVGVLPLPPGSRVMQTGGFKGRSREVDAAVLRAALAERFALEPADIVAEYGMTELSSQLYQAGATAYHPPPWLRVQAVDPVTLAPVPRGTVGIARFVDLANVDSAVAVQTADLVTENADGSIELHGRAPGATPRGCSLALEDLVSDPAIKTD
jgi:acyl-protein synthetase LuxE